MNDQTQAKERYLSLFLDPRGSSNLKTHWKVTGLWYLVLISSAMAIEYLPREWPSEVQQALNGLWLIIAVYLLGVAYIRRAHSRGRSAYFCLLLFIPPISLWPLFELWFFPENLGSKQANARSEPNFSSNIESETETNANSNT